MFKKWTEREIRFLKENYPPKDKGPRYVAEKLGRPYSAVMTKARKLKVRSEKNTKWEQWQIDYLKEYYRYIPTEVIQEKLGKSYSAILEKVQVHHFSRKQSAPFTKEELTRLKGIYPNKKFTKTHLERIFKKKYDHIRKAANALGLHREHVMTEYEIDYLKKHYKTKTTDEIAEKLKLTHGIIKWQKRKLGLKRGNSRTWTEAEKNFLIKNYEKLSLEQIAEKLGRTVRSIRHYSKKTGVNTNTRNLWTEEEIDYIMKNYKKMNCEQMSWHMDRSWAAVNTKVLEILADSPEELASRKTKYKKRKKIE